MISEISIRDFAIINQLQIHFQSGLNIITGETGAGKSIVIEAVSLALGSRADTAFVRTGREKAVIRLVVEADGPQISQLLEEQGIPREQPLTILREISVSGKNVCRVNGETVPVSFLNRLCKKIADIHGQYDHQSLLLPDNHIAFVDLSDPKSIVPAKEQVKALYHSYSRIRQELASLSHDQAEDERKRDFMRFELSEIRSVNPCVDEDTQLEQDLLLLQNSETLYENLSAAHQLLSEDSPSVMEGLGGAMRCLSEIQTLSPELGSLSETLTDCYYRLEDLNALIRREADSISFSQSDLNDTINRLELLSSLKRKYGGSLEKVLQYADHIEQELAAEENLDLRRDELTAKLGQTEARLKEACDELTQKRKEASKRMEEGINLELSQLNFKDARLSVSFSPLSQNSKHPAYSAEGADQVEFLITTNRGERPKPLAKIASGGEISRIMLAFKRIIGDYDRIPTLIFDEIDSGISGVTASIVGRKLSEIAKNHQVICITHLPQIAAFGDHHFRIEKSTQSDETSTAVVPLDHAEKVREIARLLGGVNITETTLKSAEELLSLSH